MIELLSDPSAWVSLAVLTLMEVVLGIDNIVFITILCARLPKVQQLPARRLGLGVALASRLMLLLGIAWVMRLTEPLFTLVVEWTGKDLILVGGGLFLLYKSTSEIYESVEHTGQNAPPDSKDPDGPGPKTVSYSGVILQIMVLDVVFSLDSVITAVGMAEHIPVMVTAMLIAVGVMMVFAGPIGDFIEDHPSIRVLALAFLVLIGVMLIAEGTGQHVSKGYIYAAMGFSLLVQMLNIRMEKRNPGSGSSAVDLKDEAVD
ncbi:MAG: TerC family protein [Nannocystaceae bacterium]|nr:TerC family protein [Nannocystaceae bacterium]